MPLTPASGWQGVHTCLLGDEKNKEAKPSSLVEKPGLTPLPTGGEAEGHAAAYTSNGSPSIRLAPQKKRKNPSPTLESRQTVAQPGVRVPPPKAQVNLFGERKGKQQTP